MTKVVLSIAGSDPSGGAGIQADLKTLHAHGVYGLTVPTLITVQNTLGVQAVHPLPAELVQHQIQVLLDDFEVEAIKIGALGNRAIIEAVHEVLQALNVPVVLDPVLVSTSGKSLLEDAAISALQKWLFPLCTLITPNLPELQVLYRGKVPTEGNFLVKGGHGNGTVLTDTLWMAGERVVEFHAERQSTRNLHGTGCTLSSSIAAHLTSGFSLPEAVRQAHAYLQGAIRHAPDLGQGSGGLNHFWQQNGAAFAEMDSSLCSGQSH
ncbi:bifunctional hydroxymethylpyrimidine kinase/phosphomethylpyrimidine kinase [Deinococcus cellulosilyticus]|uniref:hydroxymethylpyrimidine kinase n=1 Tax=Deinococcus cellulosilyticus (strain DSM 18568 / NBRC 106333 / KACC 11606 / 5516J-15) TaxID=1223518 RepID=A0A511N5F1_DEIC1|nr:bifunctional hydroxymethylpyrimidine kinase/phosphomethylpyrimidine kinase [Deinococcus cellulosilyticus]GEM48080.1 hydroxymethylpyrimidine/phosphomethylpyrimidine kinase [Deinococcus cellulosilyticus NBRC 106333 = KACC 11606]